jgi:cyclopropane fatty-acyl-phospholipid synthase-like methyltransferase
MTRFLQIVRLNPDLQKLLGTATSSDRFFDALWLRKRIFPGSTVPAIRQLFGIE